MKKIYAIYPVDALIPNEVNSQYLTSVWRPEPRASALQRFEPSGAISERDFSMVDLSNDDTQTVKIACFQASSAMQAWRDLKPGAEILLSITEYPEDVARDFLWAIDSTDRNIWSELINPAVDLALAWKRLESINDPNTSDIAADLRDVIDEMTTQIRLAVKQRIGRALGKPGYPTINLRALGEPLPDDAETGY